MKFLLFFVLIFNFSAWSQNGKIRLADYPSLQNPQVITSTVAFGDTSVFFCSFNSFVGTDGKFILLIFQQVLLLKVQIN